MRVEEMALRSEIRQMLNEAGYNKNTLKGLVKEILVEETRKAIHQAVNETNYNLEAWIKGHVNSLINQAVDRSVQQRITDKLINRYFSRMDVSVKVSPMIDEDK